jgi:hypothetical protein
MQYLAGNLARLREVEHRLCDVLGASNLRKGRQCAQELLGIVLVQRGIDDSWSYHVHANALRRVFHRQTAGYRVDTALGDHRSRSSESRKRMINNRTCDAHHTAAALLREHPFHGQLRRMDKSFQVGGRQRLEILERVLGERLRKEDARIVHQGIDRAEPLYRGTNDHLGRRGQTDVTVNERQLVRALQLVLVTDVPSSV